MRSEKALWAAVVLLSVIVGLLGVDRFRTAEAVKAHSDQLERAGLIRTHNDRVFIGNTLDLERRIDRLEARLANRKIGDASP